MKMLQTVYKFKKDENASNKGSVYMLARLFACPNGLA